MTWRDHTIPWEECDDGRRAALRTAWSLGDLSYKLDGSQTPVYEDIRASHGKVESSADRVYVLDIGRRWGKDYLMAVMAAEEMIRHPRGRIPYGAMSKESVRDILWPIMVHVFSDCPPDIRPEANEVRREWTHANGCVIKAIGCNADPDALRGPFATAVFLTECAFYRRLGYVLGSVIDPMMLTSPEGFAVYGSSPPESPEHEWSSEVVPQAKATGFYAHRTIEDNPRISEGQREAFIRKAGGRESTRCRREYFAEHVVEETLAIVPEFAREEATIVHPIERPPYCDRWVSMDVGFNDYSVAALSHFDFKADRIHVEGEVVRVRSTAATVDRAVAEEELRLWGGEAPYRRVVDAQPIVVAELNRDFSDPRAWWNADPDVPRDLLEYIRREGGRWWSQTRNDDLQSQVNDLRTTIGERKIRFAPECKTIVAHMRHGVWKETPSGEPRAFARSGKHGHFDGVAAVMYLQRNVDRHRNPYPALAPGVTPEHHWIPAKTKETAPDAEALRSILRRKA